MRLFIIYSMILFNTAILIAQEEKYAANLKGNPASKELHYPLEVVQEDLTSSHALLHPQEHLLHPQEQLPYLEQPLLPYPLQPPPACGCKSSSHPTWKPCTQPSPQPSLQPTVHPSPQPTTICPSSKPSFRPTNLEVCVKNSDCENDSCGRATADVVSGEALVCCNSKGLSLFFNSYYCTQLPNGASCWKNEMCKSSFCRDNGVVNNGLPRQRGYCAEFISFSPSPEPTQSPTHPHCSLQVGEECVINSECETAACGLESSALNARLVCCSTQTKFTFFFNSYCTNLTRGIACVNNEQCANGKCRNNFFAPALPGECN